MKIFIDLDNNYKQIGSYYIENGIRINIPFNNLKKLDISKIYGVYICEDVDKHTKTCFICTNELLTDKIKNFKSYIGG